VKEKPIDKIEKDPTFDLASLAIDTGIPDLASNYDQYLCKKINQVSNRFKRTN